MGVCLTTVRHVHANASVLVCVTECMNYLLVISHKKHIILTAQDKALLNLSLTIIIALSCPEGEKGS